MRKKQAKKRIVFQDPVYGSRNITKLINFVMFDGKKNLAQSIVYDAFKLVETKTKKKAMDIFNKAIDNLMPSLELKVRRIAGSNYQIPTEVKPDRKITLALKWLVIYARVRNEKSMIDKLACEIIDAANNIGGAIKKKEDVHKMAESNKAFAHLRF